MKTWVAKLARGKALDEENLKDGTLIKSNTNNRVRLILLYQHFC